MTEKLSITDVLEGYKTCDIDTLALRTGHSLQVVEAMLTNLMRKKQVKLVNGLYQLTNASVKDNNKLEPKLKPKPKKPQQKLKPNVKNGIDADADAGSSNKKQNQSKVHKVHKVQPNSQKRRTVEDLRNVLRQSGREMRVSELAEATGFASGTISTLLKTDVERGDVICESKEADVEHGDIVYRRKGVRFYRWESDEDKKDKQPPPTPTPTPMSTSTLEVKPESESELAPESTSAPEPASTPNPNLDTGADANTDTDIENCTYIYVQNGAQPQPQAKPAPAPEEEVAIESMETKVETGNINVPNSASLRTELDEINSRIEELTQAQHHKSEMLHLVIKLEELIGSGR